MGFLNSHGLARFKAKMETLIDEKLAKKKNTQTAVGNPTASGTATAFISGITQNAQGVISPTRANVPTASTSVAGLVKLNDTLTSTSTSLALTAAQGKALNTKIETLTTEKVDKVKNATSGNFAGLDTNGNLMDSGSKVSDFLLTSQGAANAGKIVKVNDSGYLELAAADTTPTAGSTNPITSDAVRIAIDQIGTDINNKLDSSLKGAANGLAELDSSGKVPSNQLPSYVDDVLEYTAKANFPTTGETGKIYVDKTANLTYRWSGSTYVEISPSLALGETPSTAYRGDHGKIAYDHAAAKGSAFSEGLYKITTNAQGHVTEATAVAKADITALGIPGSDTNTHRPIQLNGTQILGNNTTALNLTAGNNVSMTNSNGTVTIASTNTNTTYSLTQDSTDGHKITLTPSSGTAQTIIIPDNNTTYSLTQDSSDGHKITLTPSSGNAQTITIPDNNTWRPVSDSVSSTSSSDAASSKAVKTAYDLAASKTANTGTVTSVATGVGLTGGTITGSGTIKAKLKSETASTLDSATMGSTANRQYAVGVDKSGYLSVNVPWTDNNTNTTYTLTQDSNDGHKLTFTGSDGTSKTFTIPDNNTTYTLSSLGIGNVKNYDQSKAIKAITRSGKTFTYTCLDGTTGTFTQQDNNTWTAMVGATSSANGTAGYVPAPPKDGYNTKYLRADGTWTVPPDTNTTYSNASGSAAGLMSAADKSKLDGIANGATSNTVYDGLDSTSSTAALSAAQGKVLNDKIAEYESDISSLNNNKKNIQAAVGNPTASGTATEFVSSIAQDIQGVIIPTRASVPTASTSTAGLVQLNNTLTSTSTSLALTAAQGKALNDDIAKIRSDVIANGAGAHNAIYRGKYLGTAVTTEQNAQISAGTFADLFIGDYWTINGVNWRIAAFDYWLNYGDTSCTTHHVVIVPDSSLTSAKMNKTDTTTGAYIGSDFYTGANSNTGKATMMSAINNAFGAAHILTHREHLQNAVTNGYESAGTWYDSTAELMTERMVYGCDIFHNQLAGTNIPNWYSIDTSQLPLFRHDHSRICNRDSWWLRDVGSPARFAFVYAGGIAANDYASDSYGIRPAFAIRA